MRNTHAVISRDAIRNNLRRVRKHIPNTTKICAVVKADAYGHGMIEVARVLEKDGVDYLAVAIVEEGIALREAGITCPVLVMGPIAEIDIPICIKNNLTLTAPSEIKLEAIARIAKELGTQAIVHLKIDTGMGRIGVHWDRAHNFIDKAKNFVIDGSIICEGIYSHSANSLDREYTKQQFDRFKKVLEYARDIGLETKFQHICSSRSIILYPEYHLSMVRPGIVIYGIEPEYDQSILPPDFMPALTWKTSVAYFKVVQPGEFVGYGNTWTPKETFERIITLPVGYADGYPRRLSNQGYVIVRGKKYPIVGRVCMDQIMVSLGKDGEAYLDDEVILIGNQENEKVLAQEIARLIDTAPHEVVTVISSRVPRIYE